jgi:hypothetical protein
VRKTLPAGLPATTGWQPVLPGTEHAELSILVIYFVPNLVGFRHEVRLLPFRPGPVFRLHRIGRKMEIEDSIFVSREFQNEQPS